MLDYRTVRMFQSLGTGATKTSHSRSSSITRGRTNEQTCTNLQRTQISKLLLNLLLEFHDLNHQNQLERARQEHLHQPREIKSELLLLTSSTAEAEMEADYTEVMQVEAVQETGSNTLLLVPHRHSLDPILEAAATEGYDIHLHVFIYLFSHWRLKSHIVLV